MADGSFDLLDAAFTMHVKLENNRGESVVFLGSSLGLLLVLLFLLRHN